MLPELGRLIRAIVDGPDPARLPPPSEVLAVLPVDEYEPSFGYSQGKYLYQGYAIEAGGAARSHVGLLNPANSGVVATIRSIEANSDVDALIFTIASAAQVAGFDKDGTVHVRDTRLRVALLGNRITSCFVITDDVALTGDSARRMFIRNEMTNTNYFRCDNDFVLFPQAALLVLPDTNSKGLACSFVWDERRYDPKEVAGVNPRIYS